MIGTTISHYRITSKLGEGGMGEVYRARDERLDRDVAIKVLPDAMAKDSDRLARFEREAKAVARLSHPNILEIFELGAHEGRPFIVTEILEGETLKDRLDQGSLGWRKAAEIGAAIADGIAAAHHAGIVHRDLKPSNVFLTTDGRVKVLDFGLARSLEIEDADESRSPTVSRYTEPGAVFGTVGYMSPEQVRGQPAEHRADIFALGCVLYEMVSGRRAFSGPSSVETMNAILKEDPSDLRSLSGDLSPSLCDVIVRCLEKRPEARFQSAQDLAFALRASLKEDSGPMVQPTSDEKSIVVLPFDNLSPDPDNEYFAHGLTEEIISDLSKVRSLRVISRTSAMLLKGTKKNPPTIGKELNVRYVLEGSVRKAGNNLRITAQLIEAQTDVHLWSDKYVGTLDDVFDIQENVSASIVDALRLELSLEDRQRLAVRPAQDIREYECYQQARLEIWRGTEASLDRALKIIQNGLAIVGESARLYAAKGQVYTQFVHMGLRDDPDYLEKADECARKVFELDPGSADGHSLRAFIHYKRGQLKDVARAAARALEVDPNHTDALFFHPVHIALGRVDVAKPTIEKLIELDPLHPFNYWWVGCFELVQGRFASAVDGMATWRRMDPDNWMSQWAYGVALGCNGQRDEACSVFARMWEREPDSVWGKCGRFLELCWRGNKQEALAAVSSDWTDFWWNDEFGAWSIAVGFALIDAKDQALKWLEHATLTRQLVNYPFLSSIDPGLENLRGDERFQRLMERVKHEWETLEI